MTKGIVDEIRKFVEEECNKPTAKYGKEPYEFHFIPMRNYAIKLVQKLGGDEEVVELAAWLHDIGSVISGRNNHHITGAQIASKILRELNYPSKKINQIVYCIFNHRGSQNNDRKTLESQIISDADALSNFDNISGIFKAAFVYEGQTQGEAKVSTFLKLTRKWEQLYFSESKEIIKPKYEAVKLLFE